MQISLSPMHREDHLVASVSSDVLTLNGAAFDFSGVPEGATLPQGAVSCDWLASDVQRFDGEIHLTLILPHGANAPEETRFPVPVTVSDGPVSLPLYETGAEPEV